jgi:hypothetical protein
LVIDILSHIKTTTVYNYGVRGTVGATYGFSVWSSIGPGFWYEQGKEVEPGFCCFGSELILISTLEELHYSDPFI